MAKKEYTFIEAKFSNNLLDSLNKLGEEEWEIALYEQVYGVTKIILVRDKKSK